MADPVAVVTAATADPVTTASLVTLGMGLIRAIEKGGVALINAIRRRNGNGGDSMAGALRELAAAQREMAVTQRATAENVGKVTERLEALQIDSKLAKQTLDRELVPRVENVKHAMGNALTGIDAISRDVDCIRDEVATVKVVQTGVATAVEVIRSDVALVKARAT